MEKGTQKISVVFAFYIEQEWKKPHVTDTLC